jgi:adenylate cyclase
MSGDPEQEYFSDGISEDIITDLSKVSALYVVARNTAFQFKGKAVDVPVLARQLNVSHVLEGSVRKAGRKVRITAQLIDGAAGGHVWAERYDRDLDDIFTLQDEISQAIVGALKLKLLPEEKQAIERRGTDSADAYNLFLMARQYMNAGNRGDPRREEAIVRLCRRATDIDPRYARAWALMAFAQSILVYFHGRSGDDGLRAAERALSLDPQLAEPHAVKAKVFSANARHEEAFAELEIALRLDPESMEVNQRAGNMYLGARRFEEAIGHFSKAAALSETDYEATGQQIPAYAALGDRDGLRRAAQTTLQRVERAIAQDRSNGGAISFGVIALSVLGETDRAREWIGRALLIDPDNMMMRYNFACALSAWAKDADGAIELLGPVFASPQVHLLSLAQTDPDFDPIRGDPRFAAMLAVAEARTSEATAGSAPHEG